MSTEQTRVGTLLRLLARPDVRIVLGLLLPLAVATYQMWRLHTYTTDDAFISFRYARNLVDGHGLVYNIGERVEGYTNFSWTLLIAGALALGIDPETFTAVLGGAFGLGTIVLTYRLAERLLPQSPIPCIATWLLATSPGACGHAVFGLETSMFVCLVVAGILVFVREEQRDARWPWSGLLFALAGLTRPEAPLFLGLMMLHMGDRPLISIAPLARIGRRVFGGEDHDWRGPMLVLAVFAASLGMNMIQRDILRSESATASSIALLVAGAVLAVLCAPRSLIARRNLVRVELYLLPTIVHAVWRFKYYGSWLPHTLKAKTGDLGRQFSDGLYYLDHYIADVEGPLVWFVFIAVALAITKRDPIRLALASMFGAYCSYVVLVGGDWMLLGRFFVPLLPILYLLIGPAARELFLDPSAPRPEPGALPRGLSITSAPRPEPGALPRGLVRERTLAWALILALPFLLHQRNVAFGRAYKLVDNERDYWIETAGGIGEWFVEQEQAQGEAVRGTIAMGDIGRIGWVTNYPVFDVLGLVEPTTAEASGGHRRRTGPDFLDSFYAAAPRYYVTASGTGRCHEAGAPVLRAIQRDPRFKQRYSLRAQIRGETRKRLHWCVFEDTR